MPRTRSALHHLVDLSEIEPTSVRLGINLLHRRHQHVIRPGRFEQRRIGLGGAGIVLQIVFVVELGRVDEDAHHDRGVFTPRTLHERAVTGMQGAHRRYESDACGIERIEPGTEFLDACK